LELAKGPYEHDDVNEAEKSERKALEEGIKCRSEPVRRKKLFHTSEFCRVRY